MGRIAPAAVAAATEDRKSYFLLRNGFPVDSSRELILAAACLFTTLSVAFSRACLSSFFEAAISVALYVGDFGGGAGRCMYSGSRSRRRSCSISAICRFTSLYSARLMPAFLADLCSVIRCWRSLTSGRMYSWGVGGENYVRKDIFIQNSR